MSKEKRLAWADEYVQKACADLSLPVPKVVERESRIVGMQLNVHVTDSEIRSITSSTKLPWPELRLSNKSLTEYDDEQLRFQLTLALVANASAHRSERWMSWFAYGLAVPIGAGVFFNMLWLAILSAVLGIAGLMIGVWLRTKHLRRKTLLDVVRYTGEPNALYRFLQNPGPTPVWLPDFMRKQDEKILQGDIAYFQKQLEHEGLDGK